MSIQVKKVFKAVNSKALVKEISSFVEEGFTDLGVSWDSDSQREAFVEITEDYLTEMMEVEGKIVSFKVIGDRRNNKVSDNEKGIYHIDIQFRQKDCLNVTQLCYTITHLEDEKSNTIDFVLFP